MDYRAMDRQAEELRAVGASHRVDRPAAVPSHPVDAVLSRIRAQRIHIDGDTDGVAEDRGAEGPAVRPADTESAVGLHAALAAVKP